MSKNLLVFFFLAIVFGLNAQTLQLTGVVPLEEYYNYKTDDNLHLSDVSYFKDVNNHLDKFVGTWLGTFDNKTLELQISILENVYGVRLSFDKLLIKYKITDINGNEIVNTLPLFDEYKYHMNGKYFASNTSVYQALYIGYEVECNQKGYAMLKFIDPTTIDFWIAPMNDMIGEGCPTGNIHIMPTEESSAVTLTKQ